MWHTLRLVSDDRPAEGLMQVRRSDVSDALGASQSRSVCQDHESLQPPRQASCLTVPCRQQRRHKKQGEDRKNSARPDV